MTNYLNRTDAFMASLSLDTYRVGGSVRDEILGRNVKDADYIVRGISLAGMRERLRGHPPVDLAVRPLKLRDGRQAGWRVSGRGLGCIEIVLPRVERSTGPGHRDFEIVLDPNLSLEEDAKRRDFTFNALYKRIATGDVLDPTGRGVADLMRKRINVTHYDSFRDDPLRTLRALRFVSTLDYDLGAETAILMSQHAQHVSGLTKKGYTSGTARDELFKLLMGQAPARALATAAECRVLGYAFPEVTLTEFSALATASSVNAPLEVRLALLFKIGGWIVASERLNVSRKLNASVRALLAEPAPRRVDAATVRHERVRLGDTALSDLYLLWMCRSDSKKYLIDLAHMEGERDRALTAGVPRSAHELCVGGADVAALGVRGPAVGQCLRFVLDCVVENPTHETLSFEWQHEAAKRWVEQHG